MMPVDFESANDRQMETGRLKLRYEPIPRLDDPEYFRHFTLSRFDGQSFALLNYPDFEPWSARFDTPTDLETGYYMLATGQPPGRRQRAGKRVVPQHRAEPDDRNRSTDARQLGSGPRDRQFQLRIEIHRRPDRPGDLGAAHRGTPAISWSDWSASGRNPPIMR